MLTYVFHAFVKERDHIVLALWGFFLKFVLFLFDVCVCVCVCVYSFTAHPQKGLDPNALRQCLSYRHIRTGGEEVDVNLNQVQAETTRCVFHLAIITKQSLFKCIRVSQCSSSTIEMILNDVSN